MAWRLATWPTRRSPDLVKATTDGTVRPPSALGMTVGSPASMTATTELVVPRSMPMILPIGSVLLCWSGRVAGVACHAHESRAQDPVTQAVTSLEFIQGGVIRGAGGLLLHHGFVFAGVERSADGLDGRDALRLQQLAQLAVDG